LHPEVEEVRETGGLVLDVETFSTVDLKKVGLHFYAAHKTTGVSVACYAFGAVGAVQVWRPGEPVPEALRRHITTGGRMVAHNAAFEAALLREVLGPRHGWPIPKPTQWSCTLARAVYHGFPPGLEALSEAVPLKNKKNSDDHGLMLRMSRPRGRREDGSPRWWHEEDPTRLSFLTDYCCRDVLAEQELDRRLPELPPRERALWLMDAEINDRGILIDTVGTEVLARATAEETGRLDQEVSQLTDGAVPAASNVTALKVWLAGRSLSFVSLDRDHIANALASPAVLADAAAYRALQIRREGSLASTAKLRPMLGTLGADGRARGLFAYYGAIRTGRWAGRRIQPQNLVRGLADAGAIIDAMVGGADLRTLAVQYSSRPLELVAGWLRGLFVAPPGRRLVAVDLAQIEARVLAWLAGQEDLLAVFRAPTQDVYRYTAARLGSDDRQLGKVATLGLGYQMGAERFVGAAKTYDVTLTEEEAAQIVDQWRRDRPMIVRLWWAMQEIAEAIAQGSVGDAAEVGRCLLYRRSGSVRIQLPSGRELIYHEMALVESAYAFRSELAFMGPHPLSRKWTQQRTYGGKLVENITQAVARDVLAEGMLELHARGHHILGSVHDEVLLEADGADAEGLLEETLMLLRTPPSWAEGLPVEAEGFVSPRYRNG
jgi:DNA polymerase